MPANLNFSDVNAAENDNFHDLICADTPLLDVRAAVEFTQGAFEQSYNVPLLNDAEREKIGTLYKQQGQEAAVALGINLISGETKNARIKSWLDFIEQQPNAVLYCFRGGMRSKISQQWLYDACGIKLPRIKGGYKAMRRYLIDETERLSAISQPLILSGRTGSGKTHLLKMLDNMIDLECLANHRGSSFGRQLDPQPTQINFENKVATDLIKLHARGASRFIIEDESPNVGSVHVPHALFDAMLAAPCVVLEVPLDERINITLKEYVSDMYAQFLTRDKDEAAAFTSLSGYLSDSLSRVKRRLGGARFQTIFSSMQNALKIQEKTGDFTAHQDWLSKMLKDYYDPMYDYQQKKRARPILHSANHEALLAHLQQEYSR